VEINASSPWQPSRPDVIDEEFEGESVVVHLRTGCYYALNEAGTAIWRLLHDGRSVESVARSLAWRVEDALPFVEQLQSEELLEAAPSDAGMVEHEPVGTAEGPTLQRFTDMQDLLMLDPIHDIDLDGDGWPLAAPQQA
jgi:hypothetical protein